MQNIQAKLLFARVSQSDGARFRVSCFLNLQGFTISPTLPDDPVCPSFATVAILCTPTNRLFSESEFANDP